jgi:NDP-sugar pyrophosphorylase family protein
VGLAAIVVLEAEPDSSHLAAQPGAQEESVTNELLGCVEVMGRSMLERTIERFVRANVETIAVLVPSECADRVNPLRGVFEAVTFETADDIGSAISEKLREFSRAGIEHAFVISGNLYTETDLFDLFSYHRESRQMATKTVDRDGSLSFGIIDCAKAQEMDIESFLLRGEGAANSYFIREYVSRLTHPRDLRRMVADALGGRCLMRPSGKEVKPGIWVDEGAQIHRRARIVAPAYIGRGSKVRQDTVITRCSSIEKDCYVDCGTVIEDSSILSDTHIGMSVDICHAVVSGSRLLNLERGVVLEIADLDVMRSSRSVRKQPRSKVHQAGGRRVVVADLQEEKLSTPEAWQLGTNPIQG